MKRISRSLFATLFLSVFLLQPQWVEANYSSCRTSTYTYVCPWNPSLNYSGSVRYCITRYCGSGGGAGVGGGFLGGAGGASSGNGVGGFTRRASSAGGDKCVPPPEDDPCPPVDLASSANECEEEECDAPADGGGESAGSQVDLWGMRYYDNYNDLKLAVPGGWLSVDRRYANGSWRMDGTETIVPASPDSQGHARVSLSRKIFTKIDNKRPDPVSAPSGTFVSEDGYVLQYTYHCADCPWYRNEMLITRPDGSWLLFSGDPLSGGLLTATGHKDLTHLIYDRDLDALNPASPLEGTFSIKRVLSGIEQNENGEPRVLLYYNYDIPYNDGTDTWPMLESVTTYEISAVTAPDPEQGQMGVFYEYYRGLNGDPNSGLLKSVTQPDGTRSLYTYDADRNLATKTEYAADGESVLKSATIEYQPSSLSAEDAVRGNFMVGALGGPPKPVASVVDGAGITKRFSGSYNESTGGYYSKVSYSNGSIREVWFDDENEVVQISLDGQVVRNVARVGRVERVTTRGNSVTIHEYDEFDNLIRETLPTGHVRSWVYEIYTDNLASVVENTTPEDAFAVESTRRVSMTDTNGTETRYTYYDDNWGTDENGVAYEMAPYNATRSLKVVQSGGDLSRTRWEYYDDSDRLVLETDWRGHQTAYVYQGNTTLTTQAWRPDVLDAETGQPFVLYTRTYDAMGYMESSTDSAGSITYYDYDPSGRLLRETDPLGVSMVYTYTGDDLIEMETGRIGDPGDVDYQRGRIMRYTYDGEGRRLTETRVDDNAVEYLYGTYTYDSMGELASMTDAAGLTTEYTYDVYGNRTTTSIPLPEARTADITETHAVDSAEWNVYGDLLSQTSAAGLVTEYTYDKLGRRLTAAEGVGTEDERGMSTRYDGRGNVIETTYYTSDGSPLGTATNDYDAFNRLIARSGYGVYPETYTYDDNNNLLSVTNARGLVVTYTYDEFDRLYQVFEDGTLVATRYYDVNGNPVEQIDAEGIHMHMAYDLLNRELFRSTPTYTAKPDGWWTNFDNVAQETRYNRFGQVERSIATHGETTINTYDDFGRLESITYPTAATINYDFTAADRIKRIRFPVVSTSGQGLGSEIVYNYDTANSSVVTSVRQRSGEVVRNYYDEALRLARVDTPTGSIRAMEYDDFGRVFSETDYASLTDFESGQSYRTTQYTDYDDFDRLLELKLPSLSPEASGEGGTQKMEYDDKGNMIKRGGSQTYPVEYTYDAIGNLETMKTFYGDADPAAAETSVTSWEYDLRGRLKRKVYADNSDVNYTYYDNNRLYTRTNAREQVTTYTYDAWGNIDLVNYPSGQTDIDYTYVKGRLQTMADAGGSSSWTYHPDSGLPASETRTTLDADPTTIAWEYDSEGRRIQMTVNGLPGESQPWQTVYNYDRYGRLELLQDSRAHATKAFAYGYHPTSGLLERIESPWQQAAGDNYLGEQRSYDSFGRLKSRQLNTSTATSAPIIGVNGIQYDVLGRRTDTSFFGGILYAGQKTRAYDYDNFGQLKEQSTLVNNVAEIDHAYEYDAIGNRLNWWKGDPIDPATALDTYVPNSLNQYSEISAPSAQGLEPAETAVNPTYDLDGNLTDDGDNWIYTWNTENRLISAEQPGTQRIEYTYDGYGRRVSKEVYNWDLNSISWLQTYSYTYVYDGWNLIFEISNSEVQIQTTESFVWGLDLSGTFQGAGGVGGLLAIVQNDNGTNKPYIAAYDFNGNIIGYVDPVNESPVAEFEYGPFGELIRATGAKKDEFSFRFSTKYEDAETGLLYYGYRYYSAATGRWLNRDPIGEGNTSTVVGEDLRLLAFKLRSSRLMENAQGQLHANQMEGFNLLYGFVDNDPVNAFDLLGLRNCEHKSGYTPTSNGCGPESPKWLNKIIPEGFFPSLGGYDFGPACDAHDICYGTCCSDKKKCDDQFLSDMRSQCDKWVDRLYGAGGIFSWIGSGKLKELDRQACYLDAKVYHVAVAKGGEGAFKAAQEAACKCPPE